MPTPAEEVQKTSGHPKACCSTPPVLPVKEYKPQGKNEVFDGIETYVTGPATATTGIFVIADIFGYYPQTLQGADILSASKHRVFIPDYFDGDPCPLEWFPPTAATKANFQAWFAKRADIPAGCEKTRSFFASIKAHQPQITRWVGVGYCWGGKLIALTSGEDALWDVSVQLHPVGVSAEDAGKIGIPHMLLASMDETKEDVAAFDKSLKLEGKKKHVQRWDNMIHGWMAARGDLDNEEVVREYKAGYKAVVNFLEANL